MKKIKKPNYKKWQDGRKWTWWEFICLMTDIEPPKSISEYLELKSSYSPLKIKEDEFRKKDFFKEFQIMDPDTIN